MKFSKRFKQLLILISISVATIVLIFFLTSNKNTLAAIQRLTPVNLLVFFGLWFAAFTADALSLKSFVSGTGEKLRLLKSYKIATIRIFFNLITPFSFGGQPFALYALHKEGIPSGKGASIVVTKLLTQSLFIQAFAIAAFITSPRYLEGNTAVTIIFFVSGVLFLLISSSFVIGLLNPSVLVFLVTRTGKILHKLRLFKIEKQWEKSVLEQAHNARNSFRRYFSKHITFFIFGILGNLFMYFFQVAILYYSLNILGASLGFWTGMAFCSLVMFLIAYLPTPGSAGLGEGVMALLISKFIPNYLIGVLILLWRFFYSYLNGIIGGVAAAKTFGGKNIMQDETPAIPEDEPGQGETVI